MGDSKPKFELRQIKLSDIFRNFAAMLDDPERMKAIQRNDKGELINIVTTIKSYAWKFADGADLMNWGTPNDRSHVPNDGSEYDTREV